jgi:hypothetical protein
LYVGSKDNIWQWDFYNPDSATAWIHIAGMDTTPLHFQGYSGLHLAHDGKIYFGNRGGLSGYLGRIDNPNVKGTGAGWCPRCVAFPTISWVNNGNPCCVITPPNMPNYVLGADPNCKTDTITSVGPDPKSISYQIYPNPANTEITIRSGNSSKGEAIKTLSIFNMLGQRLLTRDEKSGRSSEFKVDVSALPAGIYNYQLLGSKGLMQSGKLIINR